MASAQRVYTLGNSALANYFAYEIAQIESQKLIPNIVLLLDNQKKLNRFLDNNSQLTRKVKDSLAPPEGSKQFMATSSPPTLASGEPAIMENLIMAVKGNKYFSNLMRKYGASLDGSSNVLLVDPPVGSLEYLFGKMWKNKSLARPNMLLGLTSPQGEGLNASKLQNYNSSNEFEVTTDMKGGKLNLTLSSIPPTYETFDREAELRAAEEIRNNPIVNLLNSTENISTQIFEYSELNMLRFEGLIVNSCIESLSILFDCKYTNELLKTPRARHILKAMISEQVKILTLSYPILKTVPNYDIAFDVERLYSVVQQKLNSVYRRSTLYSQMMQLNESGINQLTGYFVRLAYGCKVDCRWNETVTWLVKSKIQIKKSRSLDYRNL